MCPQVCFHLELPNPSPETAFSLQRKQVSASTTPTSTAPPKLASRAPHKHRLPLKVRKPGSGTFANSHGSINSFACTYGVFGSQWLCYIYSLLYSRCDLGELMLP